MRDFDRVELLLTDPALNQMEISDPSDKGLAGRCCLFDQLSEKLLRLVVVHVIS